MLVDVLKIARDLINRGWCQRHYVVTPDGRAYSGVRCVDWKTLQPEGCKFCALGALYAACDGEDDAHQAAQLIREKIGLSVTAWNDDVDRTKEEVLQVFDAVIEEVIPKE